MELSELKKKYEPLRIKYSLPSFEELNEMFEIDRLERDSDCILREVRRAMMDKVVRFIQFSEMILNPAQAPPMFMMFVKQVSEQETKLVQEVYKHLIEAEFKSLKLEIKYSEEGNAEMINHVFNMWKKIHKDMVKIVEILERNWNSSSEKKDRGYFG